MPNSNPIITGILPSYTIPKDGALRLKPNVTDADGDLLTYYPSKPANGVVLQPKGASDPATVYLPADGYTGPDAFSLIVVDGKGGIARQAVNVNVNVNVTASGSVATPVAPSYDKAGIVRLLDQAKGMLP